MSYVLLRDARGGDQGFTGFGQTTTPDCEAYCNPASPDWVSEAYCGTNCPGYMQGPPPDLVCPDGQEKAYVIDMWICRPKAVTPAPPAPKPKLPTPPGPPPPGPPPKKMGVLGYSIAAGVVLVAVALVAGATGKVKAISPR